MLFDPARHEALVPEAWDAQRARRAIEWIVGEAEAHHRPGRWWPNHPNDLNPGEDPDGVSTTLYFGAAGVVWALRYLSAVGAVGSAAPGFDLDALREHNRAWLRADGSADFGSYLMGDLPIELMAWADDPSAARSDALAALLESSLDHPARELMWGAPGALLAATFVHERAPDARWQRLYVHLATRLEEHLHWSDAHGCHYWEQELYGRRSRYLDGVHGFVATALGLIRGRHLLEPAAWSAWQQRIATTIARTASWEGHLANWRTELDVPPDRPPRMLMQFCHGAPGFVICLGDFPPGTELDALLLAAGEAIWAAGPLKKGANLCHGTAGNGYAFLKLHERSGDPRWLARARAFAMHAIAQAEADAAHHGQLRYSLWTGDLGLAVYLWDCLRGRAAFPTLDVFFATPEAGR